ncbi:MAG: gfo/Idh/MocA family oxidoreductase [Chloroflexi bacterium]|nr:MAG: gfo/Idh/MocA family oxidoreductase [Chloroflexota bacterium]
MKIGIMSFAHLHAEAYIQNLRAIPGVEMIGLADDDPARGRQFAEQFNARLFPSYEALLNEQPDGVLVCSENANHRPLVEMAAAAGVHVLSEKPLATSLEDAQAIVDACRQAGVILMTAFPMRFSAPLLEVKARLDDGSLGQVYGCSTTNQGQMPIKHRRWFVDRQLAGGGAVMDHTVHLADILRWYLNSEAVEVYATTNRILHADTVDVETGGLIMVTFANGTFASIDCSWSKPLNYPTWGGLKMELITERGLTVVDGFSQNLDIYNQKTPAHYWTFWGSDPNQAMVEEFVSAVRDRRPPRVTGEDGYKALEIALAAYRSAETGQPVRLPLA